MLISDLQKNIKPFATNFDKQMKLLFKQKKDIILGLNRGQLIMDSTDIEGDSFPAYSPMSVRLRKEKGKQTAQMDFYFSGNLQKKMYIEWVSDGFSISSKVPYAGKVKSMWLALGLTDKNLIKLIEEQIIPLMINKILK